MFLQRCCQNLLEGIFTIMAVALVLWPHTGITDGGTAPPFLRTQIFIAAVVLIIIFVPRADEAAAVV